MKEKTLIRYDVEEIEKAFSFLNIYHTLEINSESLYQFSKKEKHILERIKNIYLNIKLFKDYNEIRLTSISNQDVLKNANTFLIKLFPKYKNEILYLDNLLVFCNCSFYDAGLNFNFDKDKIVFNEIIIPSANTNYISSIIVHEKVHALILNNIKPKQTFENNNELFSIFLQKLALIKLNDPTAILLDQIIRINDTKSSFNHLTLVKYLQNNPNSTELDKYMSNYFKLSGYNYLLSELYSYLLIDKYLEDSELMQKRMNLILADKMLISDFLNSYQINLTNKRLIPIIKEETNRCKKISIIP